MIYQLIHSLFLISKNLSTGRVPEEADLALLTTTNRPPLESSAGLQEDPLRLQGTTTGRDRRDTNLPKPEDRGLRRNRVNREENPPRIIRIPVKGEVEVLDTIEIGGGRGLLDTQRTIGVEGNVFLRVHISFFFVKLVLKSYLNKPTINLLNKSLKIMFFFYFFKYTFRLFNYSKN